LFIRAKDLFVEATQVEGTKQMEGRRLSQAEAKRLLAKFEHHAASC